MRLAFDLLKRLDQECFKFGCGSRLVLEAQNAGRSESISLLIEHHAENGVMNGSASGSLGQGIDMRVLESYRRILLAYMRDGGELMQ